MSNDLVQASPTKVANSSTPFNQGSWDVSQMLTDINTATQQAISDLFLLSELSRLASAMETYQTRMRTSTQCLLDALGNTGIKLMETADLFVTNDQQGASMFQQYQGFEPVSPILTQHPPLQFPGFTLPTPTLNLFGPASTSSLPSSPTPLWPQLNLGSQNLILGGF